MKVYIKKSASAFFLFILLLLVFGYFYHKTHGLNEIKCHGFVQYNFTADKHKYHFDVLQSYFLFNKENSIIFHGFMDSGGDVLHIERKVTLSSVEYLDSNTLLISLGSLSKTTNDEISDGDFKHLLSHIGFLGSDLRLDINKIYDDSYILGNSTSYNFICTPYYQ